MSVVGRVGESTLIVRSPALDTRLLLLAIITLGFIARGVSTRLPLFDFHSWRQADTASIARNFVDERFNPLYPQVDFRGGRADGYVQTGLELHAFIVAALSKAVGFAPAVGRVVNVLLFPIAAFLLYRFVARRYGEPAGVIAAFIYSVGLPLTMFIDRAFMNESLLTLLSVVCLWSAQLYCAHGRHRHLAALSAAMATIAMVKPTYLVIAAPVTGLFVERFGWRALVRPDLWVVGVVSAACGAAWFWHANQLYQATGLSFGLDNKFLGEASVNWSDYPYILVRRLVKDILGPVGIVFGVAGLAAAVREQKRAELWGVVAFAVYLIVVAGGNFHHNYYQLPIVPIGTTLAAAGIVAGVRELSRRYAWTESRTAGAYAAILWLAAISTFVRSVSAHNWYEIDTSRMRLCEDLKPVLSASDRVAFIRDGNPDVLFCLDRKGWLLDRPPITIEPVREWTAGGGSAVVVIRKDDPMVSQLDANLQRVLETPDFLAYRITPPPSHARK